MQTYQSVLTLFSLATSAMAAPQKNLFNQGPEVQLQTELVTGKKIDLNQICQNKVCIFTTTATAWGVTYLNYNGLSFLSKKHGKNLAVI